VAARDEAALLGDEEIAALGSFAIGIYGQFPQTGQLADLETAASLLQGMLLGLPIQHPERPRMLNNLAIVLDTRFGQTGHIEDIDDAIALHREALWLFPVPHPN
jgi:hypothetical protein